MITIVCVYQFTVLYVARQFISLAALHPNTHLMKSTLYVQTSKHKREFLVLVSGGVLAAGRDTGNRQHDDRILDSKLNMKGTEAILEMEACIRDRNIVPLLGDILLPASRP